MRFIQAAICTEDRVFISELNRLLQPRNLNTAPCEDAKWKWEDGSATLYIFDRHAGPGWTANSMALCIGEEIYEVFASWSEFGFLKKQPVRARIRHRGELLERTPAGIRDMVEAAICVTCEYEAKSWFEEMPFAGVEISF